MTYVTISFVDLSAEYIELTSALQSKQPGRNIGMPTASKGKLSDDGKPKSQKNTNMPTESNLKASHDAKQTSMR